MGALNLPSAADIDRLTRRLRTVGTRLEGIEEALDRLQDGVDRLSDRLEAVGRGSEPGLADRVAAIEGQLSQARQRGRTRVGRDRRASPRRVPREQERLASTTAAAEAQGRSRRASGRRRRRPPPRRQRGECDAAQSPPRPRAAPRRRSARAWRRCPRRRAGRRRGRPWRAATANSVAASISIASAPAARQRSARRGVRVIEEVGGDDEPGARLQRRVAVTGRRGSGPVAPSARLAPSSGSAASAASSSPSASPSMSAPQVPTRRSRRAPSWTSSSATIAALGPPMPVAWTVSGSPSCAIPL